MLVVEEEGLKADSTHLRLLDLALVAQVVVVMVLIMVLVLLAQLTSVAAVAEVVIQEEGLKQALLEEVAL